MTNLFLITFFVGFGLTLISAVLGAVHVGGDLSHGDLGTGDLGSGDLGPVDLGSGGLGDLSPGHAPGDLGLGSADGAGLDHGDLTHHHGHGHVSSISPINFQTLMAALMGFGGIGYIVSQLGVAALLLVIPLALLGGWLTGWLILLFQRFLARGERPMAPTSFTGVVGTLTIPIREGGTGELVYSMNDVRQVTAARSADGKAIARGEEVVVLRYENGIAYVQLWREFMVQNDVGR